MPDEDVGGRHAATVTTEDDVAAGARRTLVGQLFGLIWLLFLVYPVVTLLQMRPLTARPLISLAALVIFAVAYAWGVVLRRNWFAHPPTGRTPGFTWVVLAFLMAVPLALTLTYRDSSWLYLFIYTGTASSMTLPPRHASRVVAALTVFTAALGLSLHADWSTLLYVVLLIPAGGYSIISSIGMVRTIRELRAAREEIARLAVSEERLRFARDLHDLLGHSLSLIVLKSELAGRLVDVSPERAGPEIRDVESVARAALREVREAVAGYRQPTLAEELRGAREMLAAAGIAYWCGAAPAALPAATESALAWVVREGVTNVIRHSGATRCTIHIMRDAETVTLDVVDDGRGAACLETGTGSGLRGLVERVAAQGGDFMAGSDAAGGFRLCARLPLSPATHNALAAAIDPALRSDNSGIGNPGSAGVSQTLAPAPRQVGAKQSV